MSKRLVVCCDGTWNTPDELSDGARAPTNVSKIALGVPREDGAGTTQLLFYQRGVGTRRFERFRGGAFGYGLSRNVRDCYRFLVENYEPGDELYFFGFSRGAYTARSTVGFVRNSGILRPEHADRINEAYSLYRSRDQRTHPRAIEARIFRRMYSHPECGVHFIGVWDTVGALGIPIDGIRVPFLDRYWGFHDTELSSHVAFAFQALAIDEQRGPFKPTVWIQQAGATEQVLRQVWFAGVHCDVGGGYRDPSLAEIPLLWMVSCAKEAGLALDPDQYVVRTEPPPDEDRIVGAQLAPDPLGTIHESRKGFYRLLPRHLRTLVDEDRQSAASSAVARMHGLNAYRPPGLGQWVAAGRGVTDVQDGPR